MKLLAQFDDDAARNTCADLLAECRAQREQLAEAEIARRDGMQRIASLQADKAKLLLQLVAAAAGGVVIWAAIVLIFSLEK